MTLRRDILVLLTVAITAARILGLAVLATGCSLKKDAVVMSTRRGPDAALRAFSGTIYPMLTEACVTCHGNNKIPLFASQTTRRAYEQALTVVDLDHPDRSRLVQKMNDGHCGLACENHGRDAVAAIESWKAAQAQVADDGGDGHPPVEKEHFQNPRTVVTVPVAIPANLIVSTGSVSTNFQTLTIALPEVTGSLVIEAQRYSVRGAVDGGSYRFARPRLYVPAGAQPVFIEDMGISINDARTSVFLAFHGVSTAVGPSASVATSPLLSPLITDPIPQDQDSGDKVILSFKIVRNTESVSCKNVAGFQNLVYNPATGIALVRNCTGCHNSAHPRAANFVQAAGESMAVVCARVIPRITRQTPELSPLVRNPSTGANGHGLITADYAAFLQWIESERD